jgi:hypothetical protein
VSPPAAAKPMTLEELRREGPLADVKKKTDSGTKKAK